MITVQLKEGEFNLIIEFLKEAKRDPLQSKEEVRRVKDILKSFEASKTSGLKDVEAIKTSFELLDDIVNGPAPNLFKDHKNSQRIIQIYCEVMAWVLDKKSAQKNIQDNLRDIAGFLHNEGYKPEASKFVNQKA